MWGRHLVLYVVNVYQNQTPGVRILRAALEQCRYIPKRPYKRVEEFKEHWAKEGEIFMDTTDQRKQHIENQNDQKGEAHICIGLVHFGLTN